MAILGLLVLFLAINLFPRLPLESLEIEQAKLAVMLAPNNISNHLLLVQEYLKRGDMAAVERELNLAQNVTISYKPSARNSVLGASLSPAKIWEKINNEPQRINNEITHWENIIKDKPDYRDAYLQLAILNYQIYQTDKAKVYLQKAANLDPNFEATKELEKIIQ